jgi:biopolymer transport protein ExbB/TolQ
MNFFTTIATFYKDGGMFMHAVLVIAVIIIAIVVERMIVIGRAASLNSRRMTDDLVRAVTRRDLNSARQIAQSSNSPVARVAQAMMQAGAADEEALQSAADDAATLALPELTRRLPSLGMLANSATLIGLLGTITGLITAISGVGVADAAQRPRTSRPASPRRSTPRRSVSSSRSRPC